VDPEGRFVLCWLHHAIRASENPALDTAVWLGNSLERPVLVYQGLGGRHRFNCDRHHQFIMEGARDLQKALGARGIAYAFHLPKDPATPSPLCGLAARACAIVTEDFPAPPFPKWTAALAERSGVPVLAIDAACVMPMRLNTKRPTRAYAFREFAQREWNARLREPWSDIEPTIEPPSLADLELGFEPIELQTADLAELCAQCIIDHEIKPVEHLKGGSIAGYARWEEFKQRGLRQYDRRRNDALDLDGVSRLSPYLHHGHISALRLAREAKEIRGSGAYKFLDELLVWRELAHGFCAYTPVQQLETLGALPAWAHQTLLDHASDPRGQVFDLKTLSVGKTGDRLWDAAQLSLRLNGELHNNLRMTWGKAILQWTRDPQEALDTLIDLNHRFALDGNDPNSYGGLLWCLGEFDRPFSPEQPILGTVRPRDTHTHAERLDPEVYRAAIHRRAKPAQQPATLFDPAS